MSIEFLSHILTQSHEDQNRHWSRQHPWKFDGATVRLARPAQLTSRDVTVTADGALVRIKEMVERSCFGSPVAFLIHGGDRYTKGRNGRHFPTRCSSSSCPAAEACQHVAKKRLNASDNIRAAHAEFEGAGGVRELKRQRADGRGGRASSFWGELVRALNSHGAFRCKNTELLHAHVDAHLAEARRKDAERKRCERLIARQSRIRAGSDDKLFLSCLRTEVTLRSINFELVRTQKGAPPWIARCGPDAATFTAEVWCAKMIVQAQGREPTPGAVTKQLIKDGVVEASRENGLRNGRVDSALKRIHRLETVDWSGSGPTWSRTTVQTLIEESEPPLPPANASFISLQSIESHPLQAATESP